MIEINKIYNMDCLEGMKEIPDKSIDLVIIDPPYLIKSMKGGGFIRDRQYKQELDNDITKGFSKDILDI